MEKKVFNKKLIVIISYIFCSPCLLNSLCSPFAQLLLGYPRKMAGLPPKFVELMRLAESREKISNAERNSEVYALKNFLHINSLQKLRVDLEAMLAAEHNDQKRQQIQRELAAVRAKLIELGAR